MRTALFLIVPHLSHYFPTFGLARLLQKQGFSVVYSGVSVHQSAIDQEGFSFRPIVYAEEILIQKLSVAFGLWLKSRIDPSFTVARYRNFLLSMKSVERLVEKTKPDVIFLDDTLGHYYSCVAGKAKIFQLSTRLSPRQRPYIPPLNCNHIPHESLIDLITTNLLWRWHIGQRRLNEWLHHLIFNGHSDTDFLRRYERKRGIIWHNIREQKIAFYDAVAGVPSLILAPKSLEFGHSKSIPNEIYLYIPDQRCEQAFFSTEYTLYIDRLLNLREVKKSKLIYVALGTLSSANASRAIQLIVNIIKALGGDERLDVLIATGSIVLPPIPKQPNIFCMRVVPQLNALRYCDLMITHGGLGSVKECVAAGVPMLVYPLNTEVDQPGNSARVVSLGLGLRGRSNESPSKIRLKVNKILDSPMYKTNCQLVRHRLSEEQRIETVMKQIGMDG